MICVGLNKFIFEFMRLFLYMFINFINGRMKYFIISFRRFVNKDYDENILYLYKYLLYVIG